MSALFSYAFLCFLVLFFFFNDTATTEIYTLSLHDALPFHTPLMQPAVAALGQALQGVRLSPWRVDRKSTRLNSSHQIISYAVFCLKKKKRRARRRRVATSSATCHTPARAATHATRTPRHTD